MGNKSSICDEVTAAYQAALDNGSDLLDLLKEVNTELGKAALKTKIKDGDDHATILIIAARDGKLDIVKVLLSYEANVEARGTIKFDGKVIESQSYSFVGRCC